MPHKIAVHFAKEGRRPGIVYCNRAGISKPLTSKEIEKVTCTNCLRTYKKDYPNSPKLPSEGH